jgi:hypothetical protein
VLGKAATILVETVMIMKQLVLWVRAVEAIAVSVAAERALAGDGTLGGPAVAALVAETSSGAPIVSAVAWRYQGSDAYPCGRVCLWHGGWSRSCDE